MYRTKTRYERLKAQGLCARCKTPTNNGHVYCDACQALNAQYLREHAEQINELSRKRYRKRRDESLCCMCGKPVKNGMSRCEECMPRHREINRKSSARRRACDRAGVQPQHQAD